ncbi:MAG: HAD-IIA family hydrolase [Chlamydiales bacterium]|nr:HAD-IIA family hydrolase [Chlamydiales bacterium]
MDLLTNRIVLTQDEVFNCYLDLYPPLSSYTLTTTKELKELESLSSLFDAFIFDSDGVLKKGKLVNSKMLNWVNELQKKQKTLHLLSNASSFNKQQLQQKHADMGYHFELENITSPRDLLEEALKAIKVNSCSIAIAKQRALDLSLNIHTYLDPSIDKFYQSDFFILASAGNWDHAKQRKLLEALSLKPRPVIVLNPDVAAPKENAFFAEWGFYLNAIKKVNPQTSIVGKPNPLIFQHVLNKLDSIPKNRVLMIGDTLHTDILGASRVGITSLQLQNQSHRAMLHQ